MLAAVLLSATLAAKSDQDCQIHCNTDADCTGGQLCCFNGCGYSCKTPIHPLDNVAGYQCPNGFGESTAASDEYCTTDGSINVPGKWYRALTTYNGSHVCEDACIRNGNWTGVCPKKFFLQAQGFSEGTCHD